MVVSLGKIVQPIYALNRLLTKRFNFVLDSIREVLLYVLSLSKNINQIIQVREEVSWLLGRQVERSTIG